MEAEAKRFAIRSVRALAAVIAFSSLIWACGGDTGNGAAPTPLPTSTLAPTSTPTPTTPTPTPTPTPLPPVATNSSLFAVDCETQRAYVPLPLLNNNLDGQVAVLDLSVDPDTTDPRIATLDMGLQFYIPQAAAALTGKGTVLVLSDDGFHDGFVQIINESINSFQNVSFPSGSRPSEGDGVTYDPVNDSAVVSMDDSVLACPGPVGSCTGIAALDLSSKTFGLFFNTVGSIDTVGLDPTVPLTLASSRLIEPLLFASNLTSVPVCTLDDPTLTGLNADPDTAAVDPTTHVWVVGDFTSPTATAINLNGASFTSGAGCVLNEPGTPPNSIAHDTGTGTGMPGVAVNPVTHQALLTGNQNDDVALITLPTTPVAQLSSSMITSVNGTLPLDPEGGPVILTVIPYGVVADSCNNFGYVIDQQRRFLIQIDLAQFQKNPGGISTHLAAGSCAGTTSPAACDNGNGVKFFPLPGVQ